MDAFNDKVRELKNVQEGVGVDTVNKRVAGAVLGGVASAEYQVFEVDAAVCGELGALRELADGCCEDLRIRRCESSAIDVLTVQ